MTTLTTSSSHVRVDERGVAWLDDTNVKVIEVVLDKLAHGLSPQEIYLEHYKHLSLAQIHAAFSFYYEHQAEMDAEIERQVREVDRLRSQTGESPFVSRMRQLGRIP